MLTIRQIGDEMQKIQLLLFEPFIHLEIDWKNDYLEYISVNSKSVTFISSNNNKKNIENTLNDVGGRFHRCKSALSRV